MARWEEDLRHRHWAALPLAGRATIFSSALIVVVRVVLISVALGRSCAWCRAWRLLDIDGRHGDENESVEMGCLGFGEDGDEWQVSGIAERKTGVVWGSSVAQLVP
jgi:hypothetical protein